MTPGSSYAEIDAKGEWLIWLQNARTAAHGDYRGLGTIEKVSGLPMRQRETRDRRGGCGVDHKLSALERAFQLARSGQTASVDDIRKQLRREGYDWRALEGPSLQSQLGELIRAAHSDRGAPKG
jgi:hypothetical protein